VFENGGSVEVWAGVAVGSTYYFNASDSGPTDNWGVWTDDAKAFDGLTGATDYATTDDEGDAASNELRGTGTNAPGSGSTIVGVEARFYGSTNGGDILVQAGGTNIVRTSGTPGWTNWATVTPPGGSWSWAEVQALEAICWGRTSGSDHRVYRVEVRVLHDTTTPDYFIQLDSANSPSCMANAPVGVAIDSDNRLHIAYVAGVASAEDLDYVTFDTVDSTAGDDLFNTPEEAISMEDADNTSWGCAIAVDSNDIPHAVVASCPISQSTRITTQLSCI
jgi:hypothetical protein